MTLVQATLVVNIAYYATLLRYSWLSIMHNVMVCVKLLQVGTKLHLGSMGMPLPASAS